MGNEINKGYSSITIRDTEKARLLSLRKGLCFDRNGRHLFRIGSVLIAALEYLRPEIEAGRITIFQNPDGIKLIRNEPASVIQKDKS